MLATENQAAATRRQAVESNLRPGGSDTETRARKLKKTSLRVTWCDSIIVLVVIGGLFFRYMNPSAVPEEPEEDPYDGIKAQIKELSRKVEDGISSMRKDFEEKMKRKGHEIDTRLKNLDVRSDAHKKFMDGFENKGFLAKEEFGDFFEEFKRSRKDNDTDSTEVSTDEIRQIVEKEVERHVAGGLGMVDYALGTGGGNVLSHLEPYDGEGRGLCWVSADAGPHTRSCDSGTCC